MKSVLAGLFTALLVTSIAIGNDYSPASFVSSDIHINSRYVPEHVIERINCILEASISYDVPADIMLAIAEKEGAKPGQVSINNNGTYDVGPMQFNSAYLQELEQYGIHTYHVAAPGCYSYYLATWRVKLHLENDKGDIWTRAANYHSKTPKYNIPYRNDLIEKANKWAKWLEERFNTKRAE